MASFSVAFLGCKVSHVDAQEVRGRLLADGHDETAREGDVAVISTCCVTNEAVVKSRKAARQAALRYRRVYLIGCGANLPGAFDSLPDNVRVVAAPSEQVAEIVAGDVGAIGCVGAAARLDRVRAFVKIQDGCSFSCAFCVIPSVRGSSRSRPAGRVVAEVRRRVREGHKEVVLTGINLGCYRDRSAGFDLPRLVREAGSVAGLERLRLSSVEVNHVERELIAAMRETPAVCPHLHIPLQSGDDDVLRAMGRRYDVATYLRRLELAEGFNLTTDVIVGFPSEDEAAFAHTLETVGRARITNVHVFPYSPRPATRTALADPVPAEVKKRRGARLRALASEASAAHWHSKIGAEDVVLIDRPGRGYGRDYTPWLVSGQVGDLVRAQAVAVTEEGVLAA